MAAAFSRLQLAAALLEYDNDPSNPEAPFRSAAESAIFTQFRRNGRPRSTMSHKSADYLGVSLPSEKGSTGGRESILMDNGDARRSPSSIDMLRNPFGATEEDFAEEDGLEVDLESWGLDSLLSKDKGKGKETQKKPELFNPHSPNAKSRSMSMGNFDEFGAGGAFLDAGSSIAPQERHERSIRRRTLGSPLDLVETDVSEIHAFRARQSTHAVIENLPVTPPLHAVPFPSSSTPFVESTDNRSTYLDPSPHQRTYSTASLGSQMYSNDEPIKPISSGRRSRFDSQGNRILTTSAMAPSTASVDENNPFALRAPSPSRTSRFDPKAATQARTMSNASVGSRLMPDDATTGGPGFNSRLDLLRPKILIMPSPLQDVIQPKPEPKIREGFHLTADGPPLPAGARSTSKSSVLMPIQPGASNSFTPNSRASLSLAQLTFRGALYDNERDAGYSELDNRLPRATEEGEQVQEPDSPLEGDVPVTEGQLEAGNRNSRGPGKLFGRSLIDDLELRKAEIRGKRRVFKGDERPSMMARSSTFIDPSSLERSGIGTSGSGVSLGRRKTLLNFDDAEGGANLHTRKSQQALGPRTSKMKTVFGVDTLWEREMAKLRQMEASERSQAGQAEQDIQENAPNPMDKENLPSAPSIIKRGPPPRIDDDDDSESDTSEVHKSTVQQKYNDDAEWFSDEDKAGPVRTVGSGPRYPKGKGRRAVLSGDDDSEEDVPLAAAVSRAVQRATRLGTMGDEDSDEDKPLTTLLDKTKLKLPPISFDRLPAPANEDEDEDDKPLGLKVSQPRAVGDEDDMPLAFHPEQQRRTQYQMMAQQQQQISQQQLMMQAQFQNRMMFAPPSMISGLFGPPMAPPPIMALPMPITAAPPPMSDVNTFGRVDRWRRDVAVEGQP